MLLIDHPKGSRQDDMSQRFDVVLDPSLRSKLEDHQLDVKMIYGHQRVMAREEVELTRLGHCVIRVREIEDLHILPGVSGSTTLITDAADLPARVGKNVKLRFHIESMGIGGKQEKFAGLSSASKGDEHTPDNPKFFVRITDIGKEAFKAVGVNNVFGHFKEKNIEVAGVVEVFTRGKEVIPTVYVDSPDQIRIIESLLPGSSGGGSEGRPLIRRAPR